MKTSAKFSRPRRMRDQGNDTAASPNDVLVIYIVEDAAGGTRHLHAGKYLVAFDPDGGEGEGAGVSDPDPRRAKQFRSETALLQYYSRQSRTRPLRDDGRPNRPLTSYTIELVRLDRAVTAFLRASEGQENG